MLPFSASDGPGRLPTWREMRAFASHAEAIGLDSLGVCDHFRSGPAGKARRGPSGLERNVGLVQDSGGVHHDRQGEPGVLAIELHRGSSVAPSPARYASSAIRPDQAPAIRSCRVRRPLSSDPAAGSAASTPASPPLTIEIEGSDHAGQR